MGGLLPLTLPPQPQQDQVHILNEYNSFNLASITPITPKWKQPDILVEEFHKFKCSCMRIFDGPMCHITSGKVKKNMLLIWAGPDGQDIYDQTKPMMLTMSYRDLKSSVNQSVILGQLNTSSLRSPNVKAEP